MAVREYRKCWWSEGSFLLEASLLILRDTGLRCGAVSAGYAHPPLSVPYSDC